MSTNAIAAPVRADAQAPRPRKKPSQAVDLSTLPTALPWALLTEFQAAAIVNRSVKILQHDRQAGTGLPYKKLNNVTVRYVMRDVLEWIAKQPTFGGDLSIGTDSTPRVKRSAGRPRKGGK